MAHYAELDENNIVLQVLVIDNDQEARDGEAGVIAWLQENISPNDWVKTSYNATIRKNYAGMGFVYDPALDAFIPPRPYPSWTLDADARWQPPTPMPASDNRWMWDESTLSWVVNDAI